MNRKGECNFFKKAVEGCKTWVTEAISKEMAEDADEEQGGWAGVGRTGTPAGGVARGAGGVKYISMYLESRQCFVGKRIDFFAHSSENEAAQIADLGGFRGTSSGCRRKTRGSTYQQTA